jgi:glycerophosphoryl diester phosphodiesterase
VSAALPAALASRPRPWLMAHRGNRVLCPENTLAAFRQAFSDGADILETDLQLTAEGAFVCIHDGTVDRTTDGSGPVASFSVPDLKRLSAGYGRAGFTQETVPTLAELAEILPQDMLLALELKSDAFLDPATAVRLCNELQELGIHQQSVVLSFSRGRLSAVRRACAEIPIGLISLSRPFPSRPYNLTGPFWPWIVLNPFYAAWAHRLGQIVCPLDPLPDKRLRLYRWLGCDAVLSDDPGSTRRKLDLLFTRT